MKRLISFVFIFLFALSFIQAFELNTESINQISCSSFESGKENFIGMELPKEVPYTNEIFEIYVGGEILGYLELEDKMVKDFGCTKNEEATYSISIESYTTIRDFIDTKDPIKLLKEKLKSGEIAVEGKTFSKKVKWFFTKIGLNFIKSYKL